MCGRSDEVRRNGAQQVDLLRECRKAESFAIEAQLQPLGQDSGTRLAMCSSMSELSQGGNTISDCRSWESNWNYRKNLMLLGPKKNQHGSISPHKGALRLELRHNKSNWRFVMKVLKSTLAIFTAAAVLGVSGFAQAGATLDAVQKKGFV